MAADRLSPKLADLIDNGSMDIMRWEDDDLAIRIAAGNARLPYNKLSKLEETYFTDIHRDKQMTQVYLLIRNKMLIMWNQEPNVELTVEMVTKQVTASLASFRRLLRRIHGFLVRHGFVNYGNFFSLRASARLSIKKRVIIIGAGASGLAAAKQLRYLGFDVVVLEGRQRVGGRLQTYKLNKPDSEAHGTVVDLGAMVVTGIHGNPIVTLMRQVQCEPIRLRTVCPIYDEAGKAVDQRRDQLVEKAFRDVGDSLSYLLHTQGYKTVMKQKKLEDGTLTEEEEYEPLSLERGYDLVLEQMELQTQLRRSQFWEAYEKIIEKIRIVQFEIDSYTKAIETLVRKTEKMEKKKEEIENFFESDLLSRFHGFELTDAYKRLDAAKERRLGLVTTLKDLKKNEPSVVYMNLKDKRLLDFHYANLEYANGTTLDNLSAVHWDQDDEYIMRGSHMARPLVLVREGYGCFMESFANFSAGTKAAQEVIQLGSTVTDIIYDEEGVRVKYFKNENPEESEEIKADCVLCTVPLGVLKKDKIRFDPPLPQSKQDAIKNMGYGNLNKLVLFFEKPFWNTEQNFFGHLNPNKQSRGEFFLFMSVDNLPVLIALMSGTAAEINQPNHVIVRNAMAVLQGIFGSSIPKTPVDGCITRWHTDTYSYGCYSHIPPGFTGELYDEMAKTVRARAADGSYTGSRRIYFAGEHTYRRAPATVPGAWLSGVKAATKIANAYLGVPFAAENKEKEEELAEDVECVDLSDDSDDSDIEIEKEVKAPAMEDVDVDSPGTSKNENGDVVDKKSNEITIDDGDDDIQML